MKPLIAVLIAIAVLLPRPAAAQEAWCGFVLIEGLPILRNQLAVVEALAPERNERSRPHELFQVRYNLTHNAVLLEACWKATPTREVLLALLPQSVDDKAIATKLRVTIFGRGARQEASAALVRNYLAQNAAEWEASSNP